MESVYKIWVQQRSGAGGPEAAAALGGEEVSAVELRRELHTALGTAKWQVNLVALSLSPVASYSSFPSIAILWLFFWCCWICSPLQRFIIKVNWSMLSKSVCCVDIYFRRMITTRTVPLLRNEVFFWLQYQIVLLSMAYLLAIVKPLIH
jgi:hypothetical protein